MSSFDLYFLTNNSKVLSTYADKSLMIASRSVENIKPLRKLLLIHNLKYGRLINEYVHIDHNEEFDSSLKMKTSSSYSCNYLSISKLDLSEKLYVESSYIYNILTKHSDIFIMENFEYDRVTDILTMQGICFNLNNVFSEDGSAIDKYEYLNECLKN